MLGTFDLTGAKDKFDVAARDTVPLWGREGVWRTDDPKSWRL
jgi:hypothetical protein